MAMIAGTTGVNGYAKVKKVTMHQGMADVSFIFDLKLSHKGKKPTVVHEVGVDTWKKIGGKWMFVKTVDSSLKVTGGK